MGGTKVLGELARVGIGPGTEESNHVITAEDFLGQELFGDNANFLLFLSE
jgi:hypothetical protein